MTGSEFQKILPKMICFGAMLVCFFIVICVLWPQLWSLDWTYSWVLCQCPLPTLKCYLLSNLWVPSPRLWWMPYFSCSFSCLHLILGQHKMFWTGKSHWGPLLVGNPKKKGNTNAFQTWVIGHIQLIFSYWSKSHVLLRKSISWRYLQNESIWIYFDWQDILLLLSPTTLFMLWSCQQCRKYACNVIYKSMQQEKSSRVGLKWIWKIITIISSIPTSPHPLP